MSKEDVDAIVAQSDAEIAKITANWPKVWMACSNCPVLVYAKLAEDATRISHHDQSKCGGLWVYAIGQSGIEE